MKRYIFPFVFLLLTIASYIAYTISEQGVDEGGFLIETFAFIPLSYFFLLCLVVSLLVLFVKWTLKKH